jgi:hypothetical protein
MFQRILLPPVSGWELQISRAEEAVIEPKETAALKKAVSNGRGQDA